MASSIKHEIAEQLTASTQSGKTRLTRRLQLQIMSNGVLLQAFWALAAVSKSAIPARQTIASSILQSAQRNTETRYGPKHEQRRLYQQFPDYCDQLIKLCAQSVGNRQRCAP